MNFRKSNRRFKEMLSSMHTVSPAVRRAIRLRSEHRWPNASKSMKVLIWRGNGLKNSSLHTELLMSIPFLMRGVKVEFMLCDGLLRGCVNRQSISVKKNNKKWNSQCAKCCANGSQLFKAANVNYHYMSNWVSHKDRSKAWHLSQKIPIRDLLSYTMGDIPVGKFAKEGVVRHYKGAEDCNLPIPELHEDMLREFFYSSIICTIAVQKSIADISPDRVVLQHGIYPLWGSAFCYCILNDIPVILYGRGYDANKIYMRSCIKGDASLFTYGVSDRWDQIKNTPLEKSQKNQLNYYMRKRIVASTRGSKSQGGFSRVMIKRPTWLISPHLNWDVPMFGEKMLFSNPIEWIVETYRYIRELTDVNWIIRVHPAERTLRSKKGTQQILKQMYKEFPSHITVIGANSMINSYGLFPHVEGCVTFAGTIGLEMSMYGKPVLLAAESHYSNKGFTYDFENTEEYFKQLDNILTTTAFDRQVELAEKYAYDYFIYRQFSFPTAGKSVFSPSKYKSLISDNVCSMIYQSACGIDTFGVHKNKRKNQSDWRDWIERRMQ